MDSDSNISLTSPRPQSSRSSSRQSSTTPSISLPKKRGSTKEDYLEIERKKLSLMEKRIEIQNNSNLDKDDDMLYFQSLLPSMKKLTHIQKLKLRGKINDWLVETLSQNEQNYLKTQNVQPAQGQVLGFTGYSQGPVPGTTGYNQGPIPGPSGYSQGPPVSGFNGIDEQGQRMGKPFLAYKMYYACAADQTIDFPGQHMKKLIYFDLFDTCL
nr:unnamed protein product [Callosobruchus chinensis]